MQDVGNLSHCLCGTIMLLEQVSSGEIEGIQCRQPGCDTEWVCELFVYCLGRSLHSPWYSDWTAQTPRAVLGLSSDYSWLRGLLNIQCESEPVRAESIGLLRVFGQSADQTPNGVRPGMTLLMSLIQLAIDLNLNIIYYHESNPLPPGLMTNKWHY
jgi:hypothetical protein